MGNNSNSSFSDQLFDKWQGKLFRFIYNNKRTPSRLEYNWMFYQFEVNNLCSEEENPPLALAADENNIRNILEHDVKQYTAREFFGTNDGHLYHLTITPRGSRSDLQFYFKFTDENNTAVPIYKWTKSKPVTQ